MRLCTALLAAATYTAPGLQAEEPHLALRTGLKCSQCHVNRSGGGGRSDFGNAWAQTQLPGRTAEVRNRSVNDWLALGLDLRALVAATVTEATPRTEFAIQEAQLQLQARLIQNVLSFYVDQTLGPGGATAREVFGLWESLPLNSYVKVGKFMQPYGIRLWDDAAFIRSQTGFSYATPEIGLEVGLEPGPLSFFLAASNGTSAVVENDSQKRLTSTAAVTYRYFRIGASASYNSDASGERRIAGAHGGLSLGPLVLLGEIDRISDDLTESDPTVPEPPDQWVAYAEGDLLLTKGLFARVTYGYHDPDTDVVEDQRIRMRFGLDWFPVSFVQLAGFYTALKDVPQVTTDVDVVTLEAHLHF
jgi:hypothetical protein